MLHYQYDFKATLQPLHKLFNGEGKRYCHLTLSILVTLVSISFLFISCRKKPTAFTSTERKSADSIVRATQGIDSLALLQKQLECKGDKLGSIMALREWGKALRNESRFEEALTIHSKGQLQAEADGDTLEWVQALNNIGTDYRRMGILDVAQEYHYRAWKLSEECSDTSFTTKKNRVVSLNGLGNIYMALDNYERADSVFRLALKGEQILRSAVGQAINYANLGSIFKQRGQTDSAWVYYRQSMRYNQEAGSTLGVSLCHTYFGSLYEKARQYDKATEEYETAYQLMKASKDEWHALNSLIALAGIYQLSRNHAKEMEYLSKAKEMAEGIKSPVHLAEIYNLYYKHYKRTGNCHTALSYYEQAVAIQNRVLNMEKVNRIQNTSLNIERDRQAREMDEARHKLEQERMARYVGFAILGLVLLVVAGILAMVLYTNRLRHRNHLALKKLSVLREGFFTNITHEFRTPLTIILGMSRELQSFNEYPNEISDKAKTIERQGKGLLTLINQLLDISKIKSSVITPDWRNGNITTYLTMIVETYRDYARSRNIDLNFFVKEAVEMDFVPDYMSKVVNNLLSNAFKFTPEYGKVSVTAWRENKRLLIDVADTGKGIDKKALPYVFKPFYQADNEAKNIGTGVGLALVKQIIDTVKGSITVESTVGKGTIFHINVPIHNNKKQKIGSTTIDNTPLLPENETMLADSESDDNQCRLLVIEDNQDIAAYIGSLFADHYAVSYAGNGKDGMEKALELVPDLIITDLMMPGMDGLEMCRQVRANEITNHIPIIVVTAKITEEERIKGLEAGADAYLVKPFNAEELRTRVEKLLDSRRLLREKFAMVTDEDDKKKQTTQRSAADLRFLAKVSDIIYLQLNRGKEVEVSQIASAMCMSSRQFYRKINALTNNTPTVYIQRVKIKKAKSLLDGDAQMTFGEIAERCGFNDYSNFVRTFKNYYGVTPTDYKLGNAAK